MTINPSKYLGSTTGSYSGESPSFKTGANSVIAG